jgi:glycerol-3-phosphate cytidylyltransferase-like family protein
MKITSIFTLKPGDIVIKQRDTQKNQNVQTILDNLSKTQGDLVVAGDDMKKFERYALQKSLQKAGAHVTVQVGIHTATKKPILVIHRFSDKEWKEYTAR